MLISPERSWKKFWIVVQKLICLIPLCVPEAGLCCHLQPAFFNFHSIRWWAFCPLLWKLLLYFLLKENIDRNPTTTCAFILCAHLMDGRAVQICHDCAGWRAVTAQLLPWCVTGVTFQHTRNFMSAISALLLLLPVFNQISDSSGWSSAWLGVGECCGGMGSNSRSGVWTLFLLLNCSVWKWNRSHELLAVVQNPSQPFCEH